jgi:hypothetical protein
METSMRGGSSGLRRRVTSVVDFIPNSPTHRRDTIVCLLDCGHTRSVLCINRGEATVAEQSERLLGADVDCAKCALLERIRQKARTRGGRRLSTTGYRLPLETRGAVGGSR